MPRNQADLVDFIETARKLGASELEALIKKREAEDKALRSLLIAARQQEQAAPEVPSAA